MPVSIPPEHHGREQTWLKHCVLRAYLRSWVQKLGSLARRGPLTISYIDCFAGPWRSADEEREDTSVAIGLEALAEAIEFWRGQHAADLHTHAIFVEADPRSTAELRQYVASHTPIGVTVDVREGTFEDHSSKISALVGSNPAFIFVDPTGWKGVGMNAVAALAHGPRRDVMVNVMYDHINRFVDDEREFLRQQMQEFFGIELARGLTESELMERYRDQLRERSGLKFAADLAVPHPTRRRTYFRLVLGAGHPAALELFRDVEHDVCGREASTVREGARRRKAEASTGQTFLDLDAPELDPDYARLREEDLQASRDTLLQTVQRAGTARFGDVWPTVLERHHVRLADVKDAVRELEGEKLVWERIKGPTQRAAADADLISLVETQKLP